MLKGSVVCVKGECCLCERGVLPVCVQFELFLRKNGERAGKDPSSLDAFVHFTYLESGQNFVMCGFQVLPSLVC